MNKEIEIINITTKFKNNIVHNELNLSISKGERIGIIGRNGSGKTVLLSVISKLKEVSSGEVIVNGNVGLQFQDFKVDLNLKVKDFIDIQLKYLDIYFDDRLKEILDAFEINGYLDLNMKHLSGGQKQRINLFLSVSSNPDILLLDEFVTGLDVVSLEKATNYVSNVLMKDKTIIIVTHQPEELRNLTDRIVLLKDGKIANDWKTKDIEKKWDGNFSKFLKEVIDQ